ncbi:MAG: YciI family protein [Aeromicrobium sp.]
MTQYMLSVHSSSSDYDRSLEEMQPMFEAVDAFNQKIIADGTWVFGGGLERAETASIVDATGADVILTDGPFAETKEHLGGFWVIEAPDLDAAQKLAAEASQACQGKVEVRPFQSE